MIPIFEALVDNIDTGIMNISLVDLPAVESNFLAFNNIDEKKKLSYSIQDEDQHIVFGVIMRADFPIYRYDEGYGEYYIKYSKDTIKVMAEKMMKDNTFNNITIMHMDGSDVDGIQMIETFIKDKDKGIDPKGFEDIEDGSLFASYKIHNEAIWQAIKAGEFKGFSLEGIFTLKESFKRHKNTTENNMQKLFSKIIRSLVKFGKVETDKGELYWVGEAELAIGDELFYNTENEEAVKVEDGEYTTDDGTTIVVKDGLVAEIKVGEDDTNEAEAELTKEEEVVEMAEETEEVVEEEPKEETQPNEYELLKDEIETLKAEIEAIKSTIESIAAQPAAEPIVEEFEKMRNTESLIPKFGSKARLIRN